MLKIHIIYKQSKTRQEKKEKKLINNRQKKMTCIRNMRSMKYQSQKWGKESKTKQKREREKKKRTNECSNNKTDIRLKHDKTTNTLNEERKM